ncbi:hypothetical protein AAZX31_17G147500 [Glycine max]|nr:hypothetical protein JHK86_047466 [Glycine max]KAG4943412.1 hypothetical protein JHK85_048058 [Glycine max]
MKENITVTQQQPLHSSTLEKYIRWLRVSIYTILLLVCQCSATLLGRFYFDKGGKSKWIEAFVQSAGFPILIPLLFYCPKHAKSTNDPSNNDTSETKPKLLIIFLLYLVFGLLLAAIDFMYACGLLYLPLSTFALLCASQLGFIAVLTFFINSQKFTALILNSVAVLSMSVILIALNPESEDTKHHPKEKQIIGILCAIVSSATFALHHSLVQRCFEKVIKTKTFATVLRMNFYPMLVASVFGSVGLFFSGDWRTMGMEMKEFESGSVSYVMTLVWTAVAWQIAGVSMLGLIFEVSSLFSVVISNLELTITPILAVIVFHDKIYGVKIIAFILAVWAFLSYIYQHYLDDRKAKEDKSDCIKVSMGNGEI